MDLTQFAVFSLLSLAVFAGADECFRGAGLKENNRVSLSNCDKPPCLLKKKTTTTVELKFTPKQNIHRLTNAVYAEILGVPFPFIGVDGANVCEKIFDASTGAKASCPLQAGKDYIYKDQFKILDVYPKIKVLVHWALRNEYNNDVLCFEVPAKIIS
ncbi:hypothetical protein RUM43_009322 [Polyplax serrata]|uniref:MD-2-related lipid-recognition domain-containing protein n=1 Tax=Polyplax serrata TaxID=468196 RepID=A0AAN8NPD3_POLSC